jgi:hypothetical protein
MIRERIGALSVSAARKGGLALCATTFSTIARVRLFECVLIPYNDTRELMPLSSPATGMCVRTTIGRSPDPNDLEQPLPSPGLGRAPPPARTFALVESVR